MDLYEKRRVVTEQDLVDIQLTTADMLVVIDRGSPIVSGTMPMPTNPVDKQEFIISSRVAFNSLTLNPAGKTIHGNIAAIAANTVVGWFYESVSQSWFPMRNPGPIWVRVTGSNATTTGQVLVDVTGLVTPLLANSQYEFEAVLSVSTSAVTTGTAYGVNFSAAGASIEANISGASTSTATKTLRINSFNAATSLYLATSGQTGGVIIKGAIVTGGNAGNLSIQHLKLGTGTSTVFIGSSLKVTRVN